MTVPKPLASLSPALLARKGAARPAMRPQGFALTGAPAGALDDLGWNDMGAAAPQPQPESQSGSQPQHQPEPEPVEHDRPPVLVEREALARRIDAPAEARAVSIPTATRLRRETSHAGKAALTLRLDAERHLRLRLASAITNRSAQDLLVQALDALVAAVPTVDALVAQLPPAKPPRRQDHRNPS